MIQRLVITLVSLAVCRTTASADSFTVTLKVVDAKQKPVAGAEVGLYWTVKDGTMAVWEQNNVATDAAGKARLLGMGNSNLKRPVLVLAADRKLGDIASVSKADDGKERTVVLRPTVRVKGKLECKELKLRPECTETRVTPDGFRAHF